MVEPYVCDSRKLRYPTDDCDFINAQQNRSSHCQTFEGSEGRNDTDVGTLQFSSLRLELEIDVELL
jgi:hypothetical protein